SDRADPARGPDPGQRGSEEFPARIARHARLEGGSLHAPQAQARARLDDRDGRLLSPEARPWGALPGKAVRLRGPHLPGAGALGPLGPAVRAEGGSQDPGPLPHRKEAPLRRSGLLITALLA